MKNRTFLSCLSVAILMIAHVPVAGTLLISEDFTTNTTGNWSFAGATTVDTAGFIAYVAPGTAFNFGPHDGVMRWRPDHTGTSSNQATLIWQELDPGSTEDASGYTFSTTGIHATRAAVDIRLAIQYVDNDITQWAVSDQSIRTSTGNNQTPVAGNWDLSSMTFSSLDFTDLLAGAGTGIASSTVLGNASGIGVYSRFEGQTWMADHATQIDSFSVIPEPGTLVLLGIALGSLLIFRRRK